MRRVPILLAAATTLALPAIGAGGVINNPDLTTIGTGQKTCVLGPGADCRGVVQKWTVEHHGNLRKVKFTKADLRGADFRGVDLRGADFRGAKLRHVDLRGARLKGARFDAPPAAIKRLNGTIFAPVATPCPPFCQTGVPSGADLTDAALAHANLTGANLVGANLTWASMNMAVLLDADLTGADLTYTNLFGAILWGTNLSRANLMLTNLTRAVVTAANASEASWFDVTCPDGTTTPTNVRVVSSTLCGFS